MPPATTESNPSPPVNESESKTEVIPPSAPAVPPPATTIVIPPTETTVIPPAPAAQPQQPQGSRWFSKQLALEAGGGGVPGLELGGGDGRVGKRESKQALAACRRGGLCGRDDE